MENIGLHKNKHSLGKEMKAVPLLLALLSLTGCAHKEIRMYEPGKTPTTILDSVVVMSKPVRLTYTNEKRKVQKNVRGFLKKQENGFYQFEPRKFGETKPSRIILIRSDQIQTVTVITNDAPQITDFVFIAGITTLAALIVMLSISVAPSFSM